MYSPPCLHKKEPEQLAVDTKTHHITIYLRQNFLPVTGEHARPSSKPGTFVVLDVVDEK